MNEIDFTQIQSKSLFHLTGSISQTRNSGLTPLSSTQITALKNNISYGQYLYILDVIDDNNLDTYSVFPVSINLTSNLITVNDPYHGDRRQITDNKIVGFTQFNNDKYY